MTQHSRFSDGSFVLHKLVVNRRKYSAWYSREGRLVDAELVLGPERRRTVSPSHGRVRAGLVAAGRAYVRP